MDCGEGFPCLRATLGDPMEFGAPYFQDTSNDGDAPPAAAAVADDAHLLGFSDEILLHILSHVPSIDLILNVRRTCRKLAALCLDKSLTHTVLLQKDYEVRGLGVALGMRGAEMGNNRGARLRPRTAWQWWGTGRDDMAKARGPKVQVACHLGQGTALCVYICRREVITCTSLMHVDARCCVVRRPRTVEHVARCRGLVKVNLSGCHLTSLRLSKVLSALQRLRSLAIDVSPGFDASQLSGECKATLSRILDRTREGAVLSGQLMVGQSNVPRYQHLRVFYARLAPGYINQEVVRLYLAVLSDRTPENLHAFLISVPGSFAESGATKNLLESMARNVALDALQLPKSWLNGSALLQHMKDLRSLAGLNLSGCAHCLAPDSLLRKAEDDIDSGILETLLAFLRHLTLAQLPSILTGSGLVSIGLQCQQLQSLSLAHLGTMGKVAYMSALSDMLKHCRRLKDLRDEIHSVASSGRTEQSEQRAKQLGWVCGHLVASGLQGLPPACVHLRELTPSVLSPCRLEQPYFSANAQFFQALSQCSALQRLCLVSRSGTLQPEAVLAFMARCLHVVVCHLFTGESLSTCRSLQQSLLRR
ncbi:hypothetical protein E2I00_013609 [Balaenoptera physalus]|uniref:Uncharacterized protein n=1 Tax=Balaenoptera physalus TaxID=9770 RepID=A0A6A1PYE3_BALPH|nr:hypothetical protein E2I00_013609 [Balaenoptera physalus]